MNNGRPNILVFSKFCFFCQMQPVGDVPGGLQGAEFTNSLVLNSAHSPTLAVNFSRWISAMSLCIKHLVCAGCRLVSTYLVHHGYCSTAESFVRTTGETFDEELVSIRNRQSKFAKFVAIIICNNYIIIRLTPASKATLDVHLSIRLYTKRYPIRMTFDK